VVVSSLVLLGVVLIGGLTVFALLAPMFVIVSSIPFVLPNTTALALADHAGVAGSASALLGVVQFMIGALAAPLGGVAGPDSAVPMGIVMVTLALGALVAFQSAGRRQPWRIAR
jgi:DHA1 family bicyclomycin/chloramphenicol resistance-like MFS transporter